MTIHPGDRIEYLPKVNSTTPLAGVVLTVHPEIEGLPARLSVQVPGRVHPQSVFLTNPRLRVIKEAGNV